MEDSIWKEKIARRTTRRSWELLALIVTFSFLLGAWSWYFFIYIKTPEYALHNIQSAIQSHDIEDFRKSVNLDILLPKAYDDLTTDMFKDDKALPPKTKTLFENFYILIKPMIVAGIQDDISQYVNTGIWKKNEEKGSILKGQQLGIDFDELIERSNLRNIQLKQIASIIKTGKTATAEIQICEEYTKTDFTLRVRLEQETNGNWQVVYIENYKDFLNTLQTIQETDLSSYLQSTQTIIDSHNKTGKKQQEKFHNIMQLEQAGLTDLQRLKLQSFIESEVIPDNEARDAELKSVAIPAGAKHLHNLRLQVDTLTIAAWKHFLDGITQNNQKQLEEAESLHKQSLEMDQKVSNIIKHAATSRELTKIL